MENNVAKSQVPDFPEVTGFHLKHTFCASLESFLENIAQFPF